MQATTAWNYTPYKPFLFDGGDIYICQVIPEMNSVYFEWLPIEGAEEYQIFFGKDEESLARVGNTAECCWKKENLNDNTDYYFQVRSGNKKSRIRLAHTGGHVGTVVNYLHPDDMCYSFSGRYLCSPSLVRHPDGYLLASMDVFEGRSPQNLTLIFRSDDNGNTWHYVTELFPCFWAKMFIHKNTLYILACSTEYGDLLIGRSDDGGKTFSTPSVILRGSCHSDWPGVHKNPQPVIEKDGRLWCTYEWGTWKNRAHAVGVISADINADLTKSESWHITPPLEYNPDWKGTAEGNSAGNIEGTLTVAPDGRLMNIMRYDMISCVPNYGRVLVYEVDTKNPDAPLRYDHAISFPANHSKFEILFDEESECYISIASRILSPETPKQRNVLSLLFSRDLDNWELACDLLDFRDENPEQIGFQYVDFMIEGNDIIYLCRTAMNNAHNFHDANYSTFHRLENFREKLNL